jgi:hypothetical protein
MSEPGDGIESLIDAVIDGRCNEEELRRLESLVRDDPRVRKAYLDQMRMHALLEWQHGRVELHVDRAGSGGARGWGRGRWWGLAALFLVSVGLVFLATRGARRVLGWDEIATLAEARDVVWAQGQVPIALNARLCPQAIRCVSGTIRLAFDSGARVFLNGPADLRIVSGMRMRVERGRITARVEGGAKGFAVETPGTVVVDQGTEFGVEVDDSGQTVVVDFEGRVDLARPDSAFGPTLIRRLGQGEAIRAGRTGLLSRVDMVERRHGDDDWSIGPSSDREVVIRSVRDNLRDPGNSMFFRIVPRGLDEDMPAYVDRPHQWNGLNSQGLPRFLRGADYVMTFNEGKEKKDLEITVELARKATLYVFFDDREKPPTWLSGPFSDTGVNIGLDEGSWPNPSRFSVARGPGQSINNIFSVWKREVGPNEPIRLGAIKGESDHRAMYGIAAVARP